MKLSGGPENLGRIRTFAYKYLRFKSSIYARVVYIIAILSFILFIAFGAIFNSVYGEYLDKVIRQRGNDIGSIIEGSLYYSMLKNDDAALHSTLDIINNMSGVDEVNLYDHENELVHSSIFADTVRNSDPDCISCHADFGTMFPLKDKVYKIIDYQSACNMSENNGGHRQLMIRTPILNEPSCYTASCHFHSADEEVLGSLIIKVPLESLDKAVSQSSAEFFLLATLTTLILVSVLIFLTNRKIRKPLTALITASEAVSKGDRNRRLEINPNLLDDMRMVSLAFNNMLDNLDAANKELENWSHQLEYKVQKKSEELSEIQNELIHIERIASLGKLSSSVAHELNNPLSSILTYAKLVSKKISRMDLDEKFSGTLLKHLTVIEKETKRCGDIVKGLMDFSRKGQEDFKNIHLHQVLKETFDLLEHQMKMANIHFYADFKAANDFVFCNENQVKQVCVALLVNASEAVTENGEILMRTGNPDAEHFKIEIVDNGAGIRAEDIPMIFQPFYSAKRQASGIGLGLAIVHGIVQSHKGRVDVDSQPGKGTTMSVILPLVKD
ncbi:two-component system, NtrC family, sensor kinase [Mariniphaga anaerophila]|uniref:histidine kinase n=1 Tax=Mariniphaga anaerophila TaxID=1484053 RepID=A0A1M4WH08_9BACT|nr:sensor histidine kinase [Mariniphaga anaerophila]SHE80528.1 two-component system, NtrC family, sensor kinase [Mariniphaga anaerophila]